MADGKLPSLVINGISYLVHPQALVCPLAPASAHRGPNEAAANHFTSKAEVLEPPVHSDDPIPAVLVTPSEAISTLENVSALIDRFASVDDVSSEPFAHTVVLQCHTGKDITELLAQLEVSDRVSAVYHTSPGLPSKVLPPGPYFLCRGSINQAYRLYEDELDSFIFGVIPKDVSNPKKCYDPCSPCYFDIHLEPVLTILRTNLSLRSPQMAYGSKLPSQVACTPR